MKKLTFIILCSVIGVACKPGALNNLPKYKITMTNNMTGNNGYNPTYFSDSIVVQQPEYIQFVEILTKQKMTVSGRYTVTPSYYP